MPTPDPAPSGASPTGQRPVRSTAPGSSSVRHELAQHARRLARPTSVRQLPARGLVSLSACGFAVLLAVASAAGPAARGVMVGALAVGAAALAAGWTRLVGLPSRVGTLVTVSLSAVFLLAAVAVPADGATLRWVPAALAFGVVSAFVHQLVRRDGRPRVVTSLSGTLLALGLLAAGCTWTAVAALPHGRALVATAAAGLVAAALVEWTCHRARLWPLIVPAAVVAGVVAAWLMAAPMGLDGLVAAIVGACVAPVSLATRALFAPLPALVSFRTQVISGVASVLLAAPLLEVVARHLVA